MKQVRFSFILVLIAMSLIFISYDGVFAETKLRNTPSSQKLNETDVETLVCGDWVQIGGRLQSVSLKIICPHRITITKPIQETVQPAAQLVTKEQRK